MENDSEMSLLKRLLSHVDLPDSCWEWKGGSSSEGYGRIKIDGALKSPHRVVCEMFHGPLKEGEMALHTCDNPRCVNPTHLFPGTSADNMQDCAAKGRLDVQRRPARIQGVNRPTAKLNDDAVRHIRRSSRSEIAKLSAQYGVHRAVIYKVMARQRWKHVED
jgi:hypothetical protein